MLTDERKQMLLLQLKRDGRIIAKEVSARLGLSEDTIRRDLRELAAEGKLQRVHGGALPASPGVADIATRRSQSKDEKARLSHAALPLLRKGALLFIDGGTTNLALVQAIPPEFAATVFTHSPTIAAALEGHRNTEVVLIGGKLFRHSMVTVGTATIQAINDMRVDMFFLGITGLHPHEGLTTGDYEEALVKKAICTRAADVVSLVTSEKLGAASSHRIAPLSVLSAVVITKDARFPHGKKPPHVVRAP